MRHCSTNVFCSRFAAGGAQAAQIAQRFSRVSGTRHKVSVFKVQEREPFGFEFLAIVLAMAIGFCSRVGSGTLKNKPVVRSPQLTGEANMLLYEMLIAIGIAVVLVVAAIDRLAARVMTGPEEMALLRLARAAPAQRRLVASAAQQKRDARAAAAQQERKARAAAAQRRLVAYWTRFLKLQYEGALASPLPARLATLITQLEKQDVRA
jgi:hypothetical protein